MHFKKHIQTTLAENLGNNLFKAKWQAHAGRLACLPEEETAEAAVTDIASSGECQHCHYFWRQIYGNYQTFLRDVNQSY